MHIAGVFGTALGVVTGGLLSGWHWSSLDTALSLAAFVVIDTVVLALAFDVLQPGGAPGAQRGTQLRPRPLQPSC